MKTQLNIFSQDRLTELLRYIWRKDYLLLLLKDLTYLLLGNIGTHLLQYMLFKWLRLLLDI